jgi:hypothetical protein
VKARTAAAALLAPLAVVVLTACSTGAHMDDAVTGAEYVPGTANLHRMCDRQSLIYFTRWSQSGDRIEEIKSGACEQGPDGVYKPRIGDPTAPTYDPAAMSSHSTTTGPVPTPAPEASS